MAVLCEEHLTCSGAFQWDCCESQGAVVCGKGNASNVSSLLL